MLFFISFIIISLTAILPLYIIVIAVNPSTDERMLDMIDRKKRKELLILKILLNSGVPLSSIKISEELSAIGIEISERTIRLYLQEMDRDGFTMSNGKKGHMITRSGLTELESSKVIEKVGFLSAKIDQMNFDLNATSGTVVINVAIIDPHHLIKKYLIL